MASINFFSQTLPFKVPFPRKTASWIKSAIRKEKQRLHELNFIFCTDEELYGINVEYLNHKTYTDIITFDNSEDKGVLEGDIYISVDRVRENASALSIPFETELQRVMIHGVLHLLGYKDKTARHKSEMRKKEDAYLSLYPRASK
ncbi:MAG TPA: rRNA maturation RNase YbeY [Chryseosolibacter sp.]